MVARKKSKADLYRFLLLVLIILSSISAILLKLKFTTFYCGLIKNSRFCRSFPPSQKLWEDARLSSLPREAQRSGVTIPTIIDAIVSRVVDGDTFDIEDGRRIRLASVDAPEYQEQCYSFESREYLKNLVENKQVRLEIIKKDNFGREVAFVFVNNQLVQEMTLRQGTVIFIPQTKQTVYDVRLEQAQREAKNMQRGLWSSTCENKRDPNCNIKANVRKQEKTKIYHLPSCYNYERIVVNERLGDKWFCTEAQAINAGFTKSLNCRDN
ncbi:hypothetical protein A3C23_01265 [Candidatus Roizmanbacteria bacterium RIFCSPHIGHO2_02_FULL_37_13b]|uniref:TNase-like domain-containing protein n=1 Tax=Candidatus Roizmanbacteria bacterium RIFCSPLOWO2_02_FULL_36_11 TaxID=1802071 RepID=A0A1F7JHD8_9BACT|nr:MAG: hypothetical protein A3C23_01265 [Candidatus Roizmanbacteria bacterium RIFCSPHIGHO2_02_FULL_37_13b]OGK55031.1 MAG: hypothetical protein A3H78_00970 [Candidatus Roizmanbacteria bacterium RIFCSPLOWO2_02_FULL_36_11]